MLLALGLMGSVATAEIIAVNAPPKTLSAGVPEFYPYIEGNLESGAIYADAAGNTTLLNSTAIDPTGIPGWLHIVIPEEATLTNGRILFTVPTSSAIGTTAPTYAAGDTIEFYIGAAKFDDWFKVTGWDAATIWLYGSGEGTVDLYWWAELYTDSE